MMMFEKREQEIARKTAEAEAKKTEEVVLGMLSEGIPLETIARVVKKSVDDVKAIAHKHGVKLP